MTNVHTRKKGNRRKMETLSDGRAWRQCVEEDFKRRRKRRRNISAASDLTWSKEECVWGLPCLCIFLYLYPCLWSFHWGSHLLCSQWNEGETGWDKLPLHTAKLVTQCPCSLLLLWLILADGSRLQSIMKGKSKHRSSKPPVTSRPQVRAEKMEFVYA